MTDNSNANTSTTQGSAGSTLIEFPGVNRNRPAWRKELSERFREIQQRRAREATLEEEQELLCAPERESARAEAPPASKTSDEAKASAQLGLVPQPDEPEINPIVAAALRRIERARSQESAPHVTRGGSHRTHGPATAAARVYDERPEPLVEDTPAAEVEQARATPLVVVPPSRPAVTEAKAVEAEAATAAPAVEEKAAPVKTETPPVVEATSRVTEQVTERITEEPPKAAAQTKVAAARMRQAEVQEETQGSSKQPRHISGVLDEFWLERNGVELLPKVAEPEVTYDDRAPRFKRLAAAVVDLFVVALICAPFAAAIELTISNWVDPRVWGSMAGIAATAMFLYHTCALALAGRTAGMSLCGLHAIDARKACVPTTGQCARRALVYMLSLATLGLGILYSLFDAEGRTAHDILSGTVIVRN
ncbi:MAG TPA: RDD family protein [Pyrinomonadaceae bacterium]|jgi:uncharacterized RDD family membrane protein YckC|nr:RDD family protein [Pyrinomonadaceae bacterium]